MTTGFEAFEKVQRDVLNFMRHGGQFESVLGKVVAYQARWNEPLRRYWDAVGFEVGELVDWQSVPAVPTTVFAQERLVSSERKPSRTFRTSGTSSGVRGVHYRFNTVAYDYGARLHFRDICLGAQPLERGLYALRSADQAMDSSLSHMVADLDEALELDGAYVLCSDGIVDAGDAGVTGVVSRALVFGTAVGLLELMERWRDTAVSWKDCVVVETGGFKGLPDPPPRASYVDRLKEFFGAETSFWSEYSMTELSSQLYAVLQRASELQRFRAPAWCRVYAACERTLSPLKHGEEGLLCFVDLANVETVVAVQTEDLGVVHEDGTVTLLGRRSGARPRGCSIAAAEFLGLGGE